MTTAPADNFAAYYADKLWRLMPAVYRAEDTDKFAANGPLREMIDRIGVAAADIRRNIDRLWDDQSIETCDDWAIPYIGDLVDARLVSGLDSAGQRRDVANTIDYRRRKGTLSLVEQIAYDITGWDVKAVEFFRRLARTRHGLDPAIGAGGASGAEAVALAEGLVGRVTGTPIGGFADLRHLGGGADPGGAFDEYFHAADLRVGRGNVGWYGIPRLGIFVWRLMSFLVGPVTPVPVDGCPGWFCFDPTGRDVPLFCKPRGAAVANGVWTSPGPTDIGAPVTQALLDVSLSIPAVDGGGQLGGQIKTKNWSEEVGSLPHVGDVFTIDGVEAVDPTTGLAAGSPQQFTLTAAVTVNRNHVATLAIAPAIALGVGGTVDKAPPDGAALNFSASTATPLYGQSLWVSGAQQLPAGTLTLRPARGRFLFSGVSATPLSTNYAYGFPSEIGAGPYDRRGQATLIPTPTPLFQVNPPPDAKPAPGATVLLLKPNENLAAHVPSSGTLEIDDSQTYACGPGGGGAVTKVAGALTIRSLNGQRPLLRLKPGATWTLHGEAGAVLTLDGLFISGGDVVLSGVFAAVVIACSTLDPGSAAPDAGIGSPPNTAYQTSADGRPLSPTRLLVAGSVTSLHIDRSVMGPVRTIESSGAPLSSPPNPALADEGIVEAATISNSIVQAIPSPVDAPFNAADVGDQARLLRTFQLALDPYSRWLRSHDPAIAMLFGPLASPPLVSAQPSPSALPPLLAHLNAMIAGPSLYDLNVPLFSQAPLSTRFWRAYGRAPNPGTAAPAANRALLEDLFPFELAVSALAFADGTLSLSRCTVLGRVNAHRLDADECILRELALVDDRQAGCVRFSAFPAESVLPRSYECAIIPDVASLFVSTDFGRPAYAQLLPNADLQCAPPSAANASQQSSVLRGAADGSEMGAYARDKNPVRARALLIKLQEYMPAGLVPVIINVT
jgi:hypothetical protein